MKFRRPRHDPTCKHLQRTYLLKPNGPHAGSITCNDCGKFLKWMSKKAVHNLLKGW